MNRNPINATILATMIDYNGKTRPLRYWIKVAGLNQSTVLHRIKHGHEPIVALLTPDQYGYHLLPNAGASRPEPGQLISVGPVTKTLFDWAASLRWNYQVIANLIEGGYSPFEALTHSRQNWRRRFWSQYWWSRYADTHVAVIELAATVAQQVNDKLAVVDHTPLTDPVTFGCCHWLRSPCDAEFAYKTATRYVNPPPTRVGEARDRAAICPAATIIELFVTLQSAIEGLYQQLTQVFSPWENFQPWEKTEQAETSMKRCQCGWLCSRFDRALPERKGKFPEPIAVGSNFVICPITW